jgi:hypothetical protein
MQRAARPLMEFVRRGMSFVEELFFRCNELRELGTIYASGHDERVRRHEIVCPRNDLLYGFL